MSLETRSRLRNRVYPRKFDHDEAKRLRAENPSLWTYQALADHFGVSDSAIIRVVNPEQAARMYKHTLEAARRKRVPCKGGCGRLVWMTTPDRTGLCQKCLAIEHASVNVRETELRCTRCGEWKPDSEFSKASRAAYARRGLRNNCRACQTEVRREFRARKPEQESATARAYYHNVRKEKRGVPMEYIVLKSDGNGGFSQVAAVEAPSSDAAIEKTAEESGDYVAVVSTRFEIVPVKPIHSLRVVRDEGKEST